MTDEEQAQAAKAEAETKAAEEAARTLALRKAEAAAEAKRNGEQSAAGLVKALHEEGAARRQDVQQLQARLATVEGIRAKAGKPGSGIGGVLLLVVVVLVLVGAAVAGGIQARRKTAGEKTM